MSGIEVEVPDTPEHNKHMARIYLFEARRTKHRGWAFTLLMWAGRRRRRALDLTRLGPVQPDLFAAP